MFWRGWISGLGCSGVDYWIEWSGVEGIGVEWSEVERRGVEWRGGDGLVTWRRVE